MLEVLSILAIATAEIKQKQPSELIPDESFCFITHLDSVRYFLQRAGTKELADALQKLRKLTTLSNATKEIQNVPALPDGTCSLGCLTAKLALNLRGRKSWTHQGRGTSEI